jgi:branched-chain amino acid transport system permease protein
VSTASLGRTRVEVGRAVAEARAGWGPGAWAVVVAVALAAVVPFVSLPGVRLDALADTVYLAVAATALGVTVGAAGLPSLGTGAFMAIGAFTSALLVARSGWPVEAAALAGAAAAFVAGVLSGGVVRLRRAFVAVSTWLLAWLVWLFLLAFPSVSGGSQGLIVPQRSLLGLDPTPTVHFEVGLGLLVLAGLAVAAVRRGAPGLELSALRQAPGLATSLGVRLGRRRLGAFAATAAIAGLAGALSVQLQAVADSASYDPFLSFKLLVAVLLGGAAATLGPAVGVGVLGAIGLVSGPLARLLHLPLDRFDTAVAAVILVFVLALGGRGIVPWLLGLRGRREPRAHEKVTVCYLEKEVPGDPVLRASGLRKTFGGVVAVDSLSLELACGETTALIGPNGSGKTTALRLISGAAAPDAGAVSFAGRDVTAASTAERVRLGIARTLQTTIAFTELTALENVLVGRSVRGRHGGLIRTALATPRARSEAAASEAAALEALALVGLDWAADVPAPQLTSSERRLLALAAALATGPDVLLVDELAAGAGTDELDRLAEVVDRLRARGLALLVVEHNLRLVRRVADRVVVLAAGSAVAEGSLAEVAASGVVQEAYLGGQRL